MVLRESRERHRESAHETPSNESSGNGAFVLFDGSSSVRLNLLMQLDLSEKQSAFAITLDRDRIIYYDARATWLLMQQYGRAFITRLYRANKVEGADGQPGTLDLELLDMDVLVFFLLVGLQRDAENHSENLTLEQVYDLVHPNNWNAIFQTVVLAVIGATSTPVMPGKAKADGDAAKLPAEEDAASPSRPRKTRAEVLTMTRRKGSRTANSAGPKKGSGRPR